jgi:hypothetical protein
VREERYLRRIGPWPRLSGLPLAALIALAGCTNQRPATHGEGTQQGIPPGAAALDARPTPPAPSPASGPAEEPGRVDSMTHIRSHETLPSEFDSRVTSLLAEPLPDDVLVAFYYVAAGKSPHPNYRWQLTRDGKLFVVHHSGKDLRYEVPFDQPLPRKPTKLLDDGAVRAVMDELDRADFFRQPGYQVDPRAEDGAYVIIRARRDNGIHDVVYHNVEGPLVQYFYGITG